MRPKTPKDENAAEAPEAPEATVAHPPPQVASITDRYNLDLIILLAVPRSDFFEQLDTAKWRGIAIASSVAVFLLVIVEVLFFLLLLPLRKLAMYGVRNWL